MTRKPTRSYRTIGAEIIATLMHAPRTWQEVSEQVDLSNVSSEKWRQELLASGVIRICGYRAARGGGAGHPARVYALQTKPFALPDEPKPGASAGARSVFELASQP